MELRQLTYFSKVAELRSVSKAAKALHITQPSLSRQIMSLEREIGFRLLDRTSHGVELTPAGRGLQRHLEGIFAQLERIPEVVRTASHSQELIRVGVPKGLPDDWGRALLRVTEERVPHVRLSLHEATTEEQRQLLRDAHIDIGLIHTDAPELRCVQLFVQQMGVSVPPDSPLAQHSSITVAHLDRLRVMAHAIGEINVEEGRLRAASADAAANIEWLFRRFSEHSRLIALASKVDAVLVTRTSAARHFAEWVWIPVTRSDDSKAKLDIRTWAAYVEPARSIVSQVVALMKQVSESHREAS